MYGNSLGSRYDQWLTTQPEWTYEVLPLKCSKCGRFVSRKEELRREPWEDGWDCDGKVHAAPFDYCDDIYDDARNCWQEGWSEEDVRLHNSTFHKHHENRYTMCDHSDDEHEPHRVIETCGYDIYYRCSGGHEAKEVVM